MSRRPKHLDDLLKSWPYEFGEVTARLVRGSDGREVMQLRIDMGVLQIETTGRPDGALPGGFETYYDLLVSLAFAEGPAFELDEDRCFEIDREFVQFYHRRVGWLALRRFSAAVADADHTLGLMDFSSAHAPEDAWADSHEQYRPFVLFHRAQAAALARIEQVDPVGAIRALDRGLREVGAARRRWGDRERGEDDELVGKLIEMKETLSQHYQLTAPLDQQLAEAIAREQYERAAEIRDRLRRGARPKA